ncbi:MAG TPA: selenocysteine-specific translation elongation factor [Longimicrobiales bacterium]|nr:selenocysteine-specific translation elongation factor [Longimicrobiales bacterium]
MRPLVLGTAGHIDHGKTALVHALTGTDTDRLPDEKRRGITIDLGFATLSLPNGRRLSIVDVPGHEAFIRNMLAGATGIDLVMLVVAADEGPMPQTHEHLAILELLGIGRGVIALTKADLVEAEWLELVRDELRQTMAATSLAGAPIVDVSARTGQGLDTLTAALVQAADLAPERWHDDLFRMPIDRVFTVRGTGTVVTGTVWSGTVRRDAQVHVLPAGLEARVRGLQQHGADCDEIGPGARAAVALAGVERAALSRGDTLLTGDAWQAGGTLTTTLRVLDDAPGPVRPRERVRVHVGTAEVMGRVALADRELQPGQSTIVQLRLERPLVARAGDHVVVRSYSPVRTIGGGIVLEPAAPKRKRLSADVRGALMRLVGGRGSAPDLVEAAVTIAGPTGVGVEMLPLATGLSPSAVATAVPGCPAVILTGNRVVSAELLHSTAASILREATEFHRTNPMLDGVEREAVRSRLEEPALFDAAVTTLLADGRLTASGNALAMPGHAAAPVGEALVAMERLAGFYEAAGLDAPELGDLPADLAGRADLPVLIRFLERGGTLLRLSATRLISARAVSDSVLAVRTQLPVGKPLGIADFKEVLQLTRRNLIPLLEHYDRSGVTMRAGESRTLREG